MKIKKSAGASAGSAMKLTARDEGNSDVESKGGNDSEGVSVPMQIQEDPAVDHDAPEFGLYRTEALGDKLSKTHVIVMIVVPLALVLILALVTGIVVNTIDFNNVTGGSPVLGERSEVDQNVLKISMLSFLVAAALHTGSLLTDFFLHIRLRGIYRFCVYVALAVSLCTEYGVNTHTSSAELASQVRGLFGGYFNFPDYNFAYTFGEIVTANDFYNWMRGPFLGVLTSGALNRNTDSLFSNMPTQLSKPDVTISSQMLNYTGEEPISYGVWAIPVCKIHQVRTDPVQMEVQTLEQNLDRLNLAAADAEQAKATYSFSYKYPEFSTEFQSTKNRDFGGERGAHPLGGNNTPDLFVNFTNTSGPAELYEEYTNNEFTTAWGLLQDARDFISGKSSMTRYPGKSGQRPSVFYSDNSIAVPVTLHRGAFRPMSVVGNLSASKYAERVASDIDMLETNRWIDAGTALVMVQCTIWNPNNNVVAYSYYAVEFRSSGKVLPNEPIVSVAAWNQNTGPLVDVGFLFAYYYLAEELTEFIRRGGLKNYFLSDHNGSLVFNILNVIDLATIAATYVMTVMWYNTMSLATSADSDHHWSIAAAQDDLNVMTSVALFLVIFKVMKYTRKIPVMCHIHNTFADVMGKILVFLILMMVLFFAFAVMFNKMFSLKLMEEFGTLQRSLIGMFQLMNGDLDVDALITQQPIAGAVLYVVFVVFTVFIAFTILIAIIVDSYDNVKDRSAEPGFVVSLANRLEGWMALASTDTTAPPRPDKEGLSTQQSIALILRKLDRLEEHLGLDHENTKGDHVDSKPNPLRTLEESPTVINF